MTEKAKLELVEDSAPDSVFDDLETLRKTATIKVTRRVVQVNVTVGKPKNNVYFRCHPDPAMSLDASVLVDPNKSDDIYFVAPSMLKHPAVLPRLRKVTIAVVYTWPGGAISLWPVPFAEENRIACWKSARTAYELSKTEMGSDDLELRQSRLRRGDRRGYQHRTVVAGQSRHQEAPEARVYRKGHRHTGASLCQTAPWACRLASIGFGLSGMSILNSVRTSNHLPVPVAMFAKEHRTGVEIGPLNRDQLLQNATGAVRHRARCAGDQLFDRGRAYRASRSWAGRCRVTCCAAISRRPQPSTDWTSTGS